MTLSKAIFEEISAKVSDILKSNPAKDIKKNIKSITDSTLNKMDLVTYYEFEAQKKMLQKIAMQITTLEQRITTLEANNKTTTNIAAVGKNKTTKASSDPVS